MAEPARDSFEDATPGGLLRSSLRLLLTLGALAVLVVPLVRELPLGQTTRLGIFAWLLVVLALYWLYAGMGYRPILLVQLLLFSAAAALLSLKVMLVVIDIHYLSVLRRTARVLIFLGAGCSVLNLAALLNALVKQWSRGRGAAG